VGVLASPQPTEPPNLASATLPPDYVDHHSHLHRLRTNELHPPCPEGHELKIMKRSDDQSRAAQCVMLGMGLRAGSQLLQTAMGGLGGGGDGGDDPNKPPPKGLPNMPDDYLCIDDDDQEDHFEEEDVGFEVVEGQPQPQYFSRDFRRIRFRSERIFEGEVPQTLADLALGFNYWESVLVPANMGPGQIRRLRITLNQQQLYMGRIMTETARINQMQEGHIQKYVASRTKAQIKVFLKKFKSATCLGLNRDYAFELVELNRQSILIRDAIR